MTPLQQIEKELGLVKQSLVAKTAQVAKLTEAYEKMEEMVKELGSAELLALASRDETAQALAAEKYAHDSTKKNLAEMMEENRELCEVTGGLRAEITELRLRNEVRGAFFLSLRDALNEAYPEES